MRPTNRAGVVPYRRTPHGLEFLLITSSRNRSEWVLPKGHIEPDEDAPAAAVRELMEEAGWDGRLGASLGTVEYVKDGEHITVEYFLVEALREGQTSEQRLRRWLALDEALALASHETTRAVLQRAAKRLAA